MLKRDDDRTASFTRLARDIYHARDILIKCDDTPRSIRTKRVYMLSANTYARVDNDIICLPLSPSGFLSLLFSVRLVTLLYLSPFSIPAMRYRSLCRFFSFFFLFSFFTLE